MRFATVFWLCLALTGCASAPRAPEADPYNPGLIIQQPVAQLPLTHAENRLWSVQAEVNGKPGLFAIDTGSETTILSPQFAEKLGLLRGAIKGRFTGPNPIAQQVRFTRITYLRLGGLIYHHFYAPILNLDHINRAMHSQIDGILGNNLLGKTACIIDWRNNLMTLDTRPLEPPPDAIPISIREHRVYLRAGVNGVPVEFALDTGAYCSSMPRESVALLQIPDAKKSLTDLPRVDIAEASQLKQTQVSLDTIKLGKINRVDFPMLIWDHNVLGMDLLDAWILTLDPRAHWMSLRALAAAH